MYKNRRNILAIGVSADEFDRVAPFLARDSFEVDRFPSAVGSFEITNEVKFEALLVRFPLPDMELYEFLQAVRQDSSPNLKSSIVLISPQERQQEANAFVGRGANRVVSLEEADGNIQDIISNLLHVAPRKAARFMAKLEIKFDEDDDASSVLCQTENISDTGMLVRTARRYKGGTKVQFEFNLPDDQRPVRGIAQIMRHTMVGRDKVGGVGVRFISFAGDSQRRFQTYIDSVGSEDGSGPS